MPVFRTQTTCIFSAKENDFVWDAPEGELQCMKAIGLIIGGIKADYLYTNEVEVFAPNLPCQISPPNYPHKIVGTVSGFSLGKFIACGGGVMEYVECHKNEEESMNCDRNIECVETAGGSRWCTGPKIKQCYSLVLDVITSTQVMHALAF